MSLQALLFDCDGVLAETERDGHRVAYNIAMKELGIAAEWSETEYAELVLISGGKERLTYYFSKYPDQFPSEKYSSGLVQEIYLKKTEIFKKMANSGDLPPRSGIARIIREAHTQGLQLFVCSTSHYESVKALLQRNYGEKCFAWFTELFCGDIVKKKKPAPDIYLLAKEKYNLDEKRCFVIEDSRNGLLAAKNAGMHCIVTRSFYTVTEDFTEADIVVDCLGDPVGYPNEEQSHVISSSRPVQEKGYISLDDLDSLL